MKLIAIIGPESTGKSTLCQQLATHYHAPQLPEYAREYVENLQRPYTYDDVEAIARHQIEAYSHPQPCEAPFLFLDTELIITKVWMEHCYGKHPHWLDAAMKQLPIAHYLLCCPDLPWVYDPVRENPHLREYLFDWYKREIELLGTPYTLIKGEGEARNQAAYGVLDRLLTPVAEETITL